ncbi:Uncharacterised protein [Burkholderia pseudomallei]|nr:Uncharacterised protein [Burkholderia pseudomallei]
MRPSRPEPATSPAPMPFSAISFDAAGDAAAVLDAAAAAGCAAGAGAATGAAAG